MLVGTGRYILFTDADLATPISEVGKMIGSLEAGSDVAIGTREGIGSQRIDEPLYRHLMGRAFNLLDSKEFKEAMEFGAIKHCSKVVGTAAKLATLIILEEWEKEKTEKQSG